MATGFTASQASQLEAMHRFVTGFDLFSALRTGSRGDAQG